MPLAEDLAKLDDLRQRGALTEAEFVQAKTRLLEAAPSSSHPGVAALNSLRRSLADRWIGGVCGGLARATGIESWAWRLIFAVLLFFGGTGVVLYLLLWIFVPQE
jgi:phage shock protein C